LTYKRVKFAPCVGSTSAVDDIAGDDDGVKFPAIDMVGHGLECGEVPVNVG